MTTLCSAEVFLSKFKVMHKSTGKPPPKNHITCLLDRWSCQSTHKLLHHIDIKSSSTCLEGVGMLMHRAGYHLQNAVLGCINPQSQRQCMHANSLMARVWTQQSRWWSTMSTRRWPLAKERPPPQSQLLLHQGLAYLCHPWWSHQPKWGLSLLECKLQLWCQGYSAKAEAKADTKYGIGDAEMASELIWFI